MNAHAAAARRARRPPGRGRGTARRPERPGLVTGHDSFDVTVVAAASLRPRRIEVAPYGTEGGLGSWLKPHYAAVRPADGKLPSSTRAAAGPPSSR